MDSVCDLFKIGIGPSSSHTVGPMKAAKKFVDCLIKLGVLEKITRIQVNIYGSLSATGIGHHTDKAVIVGLAGYDPATVDIELINPLFEQVLKTEKLVLDTGRHEIEFSYGKGLIFHSSALPLHENGLVFTAFSGNEALLTKTYYSIGGGFIVEEEEFGKPSVLTQEIPYPFRSAYELLTLCRESGLSISALVMQNELSKRSQSEIEAYFSSIWDVMKNCMEKGMKTEGILPGVIKISRRAPILRRQLTAESEQNKDPMRIIDWVNMFALAVSEENAAGGRVVTAPTNGACGIIPAVIAYYDHFIQSVQMEELMRFFLTSGAIGLLYKRNASISGAEVGCQGEIGVACSMAAAGLAELMGATPQQVCIAAEIAMEHNLGLTCDPVAGLVQVPCIERNAINGIKAINATRMALLRQSEPRVCLDTVIETMYETGKDMDPKYRETSCGGLATKVKYENCNVRSQPLKFLKET